jgi:ribosomal protein S13
VTRAQGDRNPKQYGQGRCYRGILHDLDGDVMGQYTAWVFPICSLL